MSWGFNRLLLFRRGHAKMAIPRCLPALAKDIVAAEVRTVVWQDSL